MEPNLKAVRAIIFDIDGVMTDGSVLCNAKAEPLRVFNEKDGHGLRMAAMQGYILAVITGGRTEAVRKRMQAYGVPYENVYLHVRNKLAVIKEICNLHSLSPEEVLYMGDDLPDVAALRFAGVGATPCDAVPEALEASNLRSPIGGGKGFVRWTIEQVMKAQGVWRFDVDKYESMF
ncbi:MAG: 3-deoxy-D-manno-octulosonate 8-phosphate phosphatase [Bacteroidales bacterium]|nr:3-deoxy-D-manno-octulosonate 8-phosphate phosphatase [Bacteroidales bacterium]